MCNLGCTTSVYVYVSVLCLKPEVDIQVTVNPSVLNADQLNEGNILFMTAESLFSPPETWASAGPGFAYVVASPVPLSCDVSDVLNYRMLL